MKAVTSKVYHIEKLEQGRNGPRWNLYYVVASKVCARQRARELQRLSDQAVRVVRIARRVILEVP